jgi:hypothetical protein
MYVEVADVAVGTGISEGVEDQLQLLRRLEMERGQEMEVLRVEVWACLLEKVELVFGDSYVFQLCTRLLTKPCTSLRIQLTIDLRLKPSESCTVELFVWGTVGEAVCDGHIGEKLQYAALHSQFVEIGVQEREDALGQVGRASSHCEIRDSYASKKDGMVMSKLPIAVDGGVVGQARTFGSQKVALQIDHYIVHQARPRLIASSFTEANKESTDCPGKRLVMP